MSLRRTAVAMTIGVLAAACATIAGLDTSYQSGGGDGPGSSGGSSGASGGSGGGNDATLVDSSDPGDGGGVELAEAAADAAAEACAPQTCAELGANCGSAIPDGCGNLITSCGTCDAATTCGAAGPNQCGKGPCDASACTPLQCGTVSDGCGGQHDCPSHCTPPMLCGGGSCGGCVQDGTRCQNQKHQSWPAWKCDDKGPDRGGGCVRVQYTLPLGKAYYCCPPP